MIILSIETSCDETAISVIEALGDFPHAKYEILGNALFSQIDIHREFGGVFPNVAKREHAIAIVPLLEKALTDAKLPERPHTFLFPEQKEQLQALLAREGALADNLITFYERFNTPAVDVIAVTSGPGLEPALWVGVNFAKALSLIWNVPVVPVNHMEGHVLASLFDGHALPPVTFPAVSLLISGGHTELLSLQDFGSYTLLGQTRDDAVGEAFDKVARMIGLPYPGGPEVSRLARAAREASLPQFAALPKPMIDSPDLDFSFSGLKTAVKYRIKDQELTDEEKQAVARDFEDVVTEVLLKKAARAVESEGAKTLILGGGVTANTYIRNAFETYFKHKHPEVALFLPDPKLATDNAIMIALAGHARAASGLTGLLEQDAIRADGNRALSKE